MNTLTQLVEEITAAGITAVNITDRTQCYEVLGVYPNEVSDISDEELIFMARSYLEAIADD